MPYVTPACAQFTTEQLQLSSGTPVGAGAISTVVQSKLRTSGLPVAVKVLSKIQLLQQQKVEAAMNEKTALVTLGPHPYVARVYGTAQSEDELYFVLEWLPNGDLLQHIRRTVLERVTQYNQQVSSEPTVSNERSNVAANAAAPLASTEEQTEAHRATPLAPIPASSPVPRCLPFRDIQLITAQLALGLARVFEKGLVLRDLKPENIAFDDHFRAVLLDFDTVDLHGRESVPVSNHGVALRPEEEDASRGESLTQTVAASSSPSSSSSAPTPSAAAEGGAASAARASQPKRRLTVSEIQSMRKNTASFCGTAQYVSPEMVGECRWSFASDLWSLGTVVYEMMYGEHMFSGVNTYAVLKKVLQGVGPREAAASLVTFTPIDFGLETSVPCHADGAHADAPVPLPEDAFARVKDFILRLVAIDPLERLGVSPDSRTFDLDAIKQHALFDDFDWDCVEAALTTFQSYDFSDPSRTPSAMVSTESKPDDVQARSADPSQSLKPLYWRVPHHDEDYAAYVYKATADANPFERFLQTTLTPKPAQVQSSKQDNSAVSEEKNDADVTADASKCAAPTAAAMPSSATTVEESETDSDSDSLEIVDDVGMHYEGRPAPPEFRS